MSTTARSVVRVVMFADISGSSRLYKELGDEAAVRRVRACLNRLARVVDEYGGRTIKHTGDGLMCDFPVADDALEAAKAMQKAVALDGQPNLDIHIGCHLGHAIESGGDVFGDTVNIAARVAGVAHIGQILTTQQTVDALTPVLKMNTRFLDRVSVKGQSETVALFDYGWRERDDMTVIATRPVEVNWQRLRMAIGKHVVWLDRTGGTSSIRLGRDRSSGLAVPDPAASRHHATIEVRGDRFVLVDHSANGTYVAVGKSETCLKREEMLMPPRGLLGLGASTDDPGVTLIEFSQSA